MEALLERNLNKIKISAMFDYDIFIFDSKKIIHLASAGMNLIKSLEEYDTEIDNTSIVLKYRRIFLNESNPNILRDNIIDSKSYLSFFELMSKRGFYSYDKVDIDNPDDYKFQLISKPNYINKKILIEDGRNNNFELGDQNSIKSYKYGLNFLRAKRDYPEDYEIFNLIEYI